MKTHALSLLGTTRLLSRSVGFLQSCIAGLNPSHAVSPVPSMALMLLVFAGLVVLPSEARADRTINSVTLNGATSVSVSLGASISAVVNVTTTSNPSDAKWRSTGWSIGTTAPGTVTCVDHANVNNAGTYSQTIGITAPATVGVYNAYFIAYNDDACSSGASTPTFTMANAVTVTNNPVPSIGSISPVSKNIGAASFVLTVNGGNFVNGAVVNFAGAPRTTTFVSATQLTASIPAGDLTTLGTFNITVFNPAPGGGTSNAQAFTVTPLPPSVTTNAATGVTPWVATVNGTVSSNGGSSTVSFEYGLTNAYGYSIAATQSPLAADAANAAVSADLVGLSCNTTFHYRVVAANSGGTANGLDGTFKTSACTRPYPATACAATRFGDNLSCGASDVSLTDIALASSMSSCVSGAPVTLDLDFTVNFSSPERWDIAIYIANDGKSPTLLPASGGAASCSVDVLPITAPASGYTFPDLDGVPQGTADICGDGGNAINGGTGSGVKRMTGVTLPCYASPESGGKLFVPFTVSWDNQRSPIGSLCTSNLDPAPNTASKCNAPLNTVTVNVVVLPTITKTNGGTTINPGADTTYTVVITNDSGGTLQNTVFTDPAVSNLTVNSITCAAANGATCPAASVAAMQGAGILIPSANLPNNGSLTFTLNATLSGSAPVTTPPSHLVNTASVNVAGNITSATDDDLIVIAPSAAKSFAPGTITEGGGSQLTITLTNPTAAAVTGVSFTDTYPSGMVNTSTGTTTCGGTVTAVGNGGSVALSGGTIPALGNCTVTVSVTGAAAGSYTNNTGTITADAFTIPAASAILTVENALFGSFNACDTDAIPHAACTNATTLTDSHITTKIAGSAFGLDIVALKTTGSRNTSYNHNVSIELLDSSNNSGTLDANNCRSTWTAIAGTTVNSSFSPTNNGLITVGPFLVSNAYRDVRARITDGTNTPKVGCSTDNFAIRPPSFTSVTSSMTNSGTAGMPSAIAGSGAFTLNAATGLSGYNGTPKIDNSVVEAHAGAKQNGIVTGVFSAAGATGTATGTGFIYSEVGNFRFLGADAGLGSTAPRGVYDDTFTAVDSAGDCTNDFSNVPAGVKYGCKFGITANSSYFGRFYPKDFLLTPGTLTNRHAASCSPASVFTYAGEPFRVTFTLAARNGAATPQLTQNYDASAGFAAFDGATIANFNFGAVDLADAIVPAGATALTASLTPGSSSGTWVSGTGTFTADLMLARAASPNGPFESFQLGIDPIDSDGVKLSSYNLDTTVPVDTSDHGWVGTSKIRFGRLQMQNAYGPELQPLPIPVEAQYWSGSYYTVSADDSCTVFPASSIIMGNYLQNLSACETLLSPAGNLIMSSGVIGSGLNLTAPGSGNYGSVDLTLNVGSSASGNTCVAGTESLATSANMPWFGTNPAARATFGIYKGNSKFIYIREVY
ncbi:MAG: DUF6701 domain-containing protein [Methylobacter sp.]